MSDNYTDDDFDSDEIDVEEASESPRGLRRAANKSKKLEQELANAKRELAFIKAGINPDDPKMRYFIKGYEGDLTAEAVREAALEAGFLASQSNESDPQLAATGAAQQRVMQAASGVSYEGMSEEAALAQLEAAMEEGGIEAMLDVARQYGIPTNIEQ
jgi:hypothetical protein